MRKKSERRQFVCLAVLFLIIEYLYFSDILFNDKLIGNAGDARNMTFLLEHWYQVLLGKERVLAYNMFYPIQDAVKYSDMILALAVPYSILRACSINMYFSCKYATIIMHLAGLIGMLYFVHIKLRSRLYKFLVKK